MRVLKLDVSAIPESWITMEEAAGYYATNAISFTLGEPMHTLRGGLSRLYGTRSSIDVHPIIAVNGKSVAGKLIASTPRLTRYNHKLFRRDRCMCAYCGVVLPERALEREHIVPLGKGGSDAWMNVVAACRSSNQAKRVPDSGACEYAAALPALCRTAGRI